LSEGIEIGYVRLKSGEELIGPMEIGEDGVVMNDAISFFMDSTDGSTIAKYWITYSDDRKLSLSRNDMYFYGKANDQALKFYMTFQESVAKRDSNTPDFDDLYDNDGLPHYLH
jgi:hypothetical protein